MELGEKKKAILSLLSDGQFHSGTTISEALAISRTTVWKHLNALEKMGVGLTAVSGKGYRLQRPIEWLSENKIKGFLSDQAIDHVSDIWIKDSINSTNSFLLNRARQDGLCGEVCLAEYQSVGRGRRGRQWVSPFGCNVYLSLLWRYQCGPVMISTLSLVIGIAVIRALESFGVRGLGLKWPNDIYWHGKKLGGILVEVSGEADGPCAVVIGLGLNVYLSEHQAETIDRAWVDLTSILGKQGLPSRNLLNAELINQILAIAADFDIKGVSHYLDEWRRYDCMLGQNVQLHTGQSSIHGLVAGIDDSGLLKLQLADGSIQVYASGEVSFNPGNK